MIRYEKGAAPANLTALTATPGIDWNSLGRGDREPLRAALVRDQGGLCAYCQRRVSRDDDPTTGWSQMKIEHWASRSAPGSRPLAWSNLLGVCTGNSRNAGDASAASPTVHHCDTSRGDRPLFLHPVEGSGPDPRTHLRYTKHGVVEPERAIASVQHDIDALNMNAAPLCRARKTIFDELWKRLARSQFATGELRRMAKQHRVVAGTSVPEHAEFVRYHVLKKLRQRGETE